MKGPRPDLSNSSEKAIAPTTNLRAKVTQQSHAQHDSDANTADGVESSDMKATAASRDGSQREECLGRVEEQIASISADNVKTEEIRHDPIPLTDLDQGIIGWDSESDPEMPLNFNTWRKWTLVALLSVMTLVTPLASSILSPGLARLDQDFHNDSEIVSAMTVSVYLLGYVIGPLFLAPLCEIYGRRPVLCASNVFFCLWLIGCALAPNIGALIAFRFFSGIGGAGCLTLGGGVIGDLFRADERGLAMSAWILGPLFGPTIGPLVGGFVAETIGWRWDFWIVLIVAVILTVVIEFLNEETSHHVLIERKVVRLRKELGRDDLRSCYAATETRTKHRILLDGLLRPTKMLVLSPHVFFLSLYIAFVYGTLYILFTTIPVIFMDTYGFNVGYTGLVYLSIGAGNFLGWIVITFLSDKTIVRLAEANGGKFEPEMRLSTSIFFGFFLPITFFWYGWTTYYKTHWIAPILSLMPFGFGALGLFLPITTYLVDCYPHYAASAIAANTVLRSLVGAFLPLAGGSLYQSLGLGWGNSLLGFICVGMIPFPIIFYKYGGRLRAAQRFTL
ncbi:hypothetical protein PCL_11896 [Purpureocillium lilacinum]|uniref:Major facilitator superfamily (MFS) profile domain-containing protein n=1 Tax=Purpureocillium lilacinum TaxID=33203 RepID=A0A2U3EBD2_PURLI|nr:hypothetical protein Purlil1_6275 [Purpureocillium lilacinum]PWI71802.1 hypothetical protein PCL_11896 [Purpureocillium lilacinum]